MTDERFFLTEDGDGHWYVVPEIQREDFEHWSESGEGDPPQYAERINGHPCWITFTNPVQVE